MNNGNHAMIDIETLSQQPDGCIISVGVAIFNDTQVTATEGWAINKAHWHGHLDPDTVQWWMKQSDDARKFSFMGTTSALQVAMDLKCMLLNNNVQEVWANDPSFDLVMLRQWWKRCIPESQFPVKYWAERSYRTIVSLVKEITQVDPKEKFKGSYIAHNPAEDAAVQARVVIASRHILAGRGFEREVPEGTRAI